MKAKKQHPPSMDLSEYAEESIPFDTVIRKIMSAPPHHIEAPKAKKKTKTNTSSKNKPA
jgi:hypothetical protein